jgi:hypothetical protein
MAWSTEFESDKAHIGARYSRQLRERQLDREDKWSRSDFFHSSSQTTAGCSEDAIADPQDAARLEKSRQQAKRGELFWGVEDDDDSQSDQSVSGG